MRIKAALIVGMAIIGMAAFGSRAYAGESVTVLTGTVEPECELSHVILMKNGPHPSLGKEVRIPVEDGRFSYQLVSEDTEMYALYPQNHTGSCRSQWFFFSEDGPVEFRVFKEDSGKNNLEITTPLPETRRYQARLYASLHDAEYLKYIAYSDSLRSSGIQPTPEMRRHLDEMGKKAIETIHKDERDFIASAPTLTGLFMIANELWHPNDSDIAAYSDIYDNVYRGRFDGHPYVAPIETAIATFRSGENRVGGKYTDVAALDADGEMKSISEIIGGKVALIDLWASWCIPCRRNSMGLITIYEEYAPKGLAMVGLARESGDDRFMRKAAKKDGYPWPCLAEIDDRGLIWTKFGIPNAPGRILLVDRDGTILAIDPTPADLRQALDKLLK